MMLDMSRTHTELPDRVHSIDGLRGVAALVVVVHHAMLVSPQLAEEYREVGASDRPLVRVFVDSPLHLFWGGGEAVVVFFVLSGMALTLPLLAGRPAHWLAWYPRRMVRLYFPVWGAVAFAALMYLLIPRTAVEDGSWWLNKHDVPLNFSAIIHDATLVFGTTYLNSPLWSLRFEVIFSLAFPVYYLVAKKVGDSRIGAAFLTIAFLAAMAFGSWSENHFLEYMPVFGFGALLAVNGNALRQSVARLSGPAVWFLLVVAVVALSGNWLPYVRSTHFSMPLVAVGATVLVALVAWRSEFRGLGKKRGVAQWLAKVSFSLYLVHEPILMSIAFLLPVPNALLVLLIGLPAALCFSWFFQKYVEGPSNVFSHSVGSFILARQSALKSAQNSA